MPTDAAFADVLAPRDEHAARKRTFLVLAVALVLLHVFFMLFRYGQLPPAPVVSDEAVINDPSISIAHGHGYRAESLGESKYGLDKVYAHFPPVYPYTEALAFRVFGISVYSLRLTTTVMSVGSTLVLLLLLYRLCVFGLLSWDVALLVEALYCTNASYVALERTARMESMVGLLVLVSLYGIVRALTLPRERRLPWLLAGGVFGALTIAVHPEAVTAVVVLAALILFVVPTSLAVRVASAGLFVLTPLVVGVAIYRANFFTAVMQFLAIARDANKYNESSAEWLKDSLRATNVSGVSKNVFLLLVMLLLVVPAMAYLWQRKAVPRESVQHRMFACLGVVGLGVGVLMATVMQMQTRRCQFLFGVLLVCGAVCVWGSSRLRRWQWVAGWCFVLLQCVVAGIYLYPRQDRVVNANPDRFLPLIGRLPAGAAVAATPGLWLDMKEANRPFTLIVTGLDGESTWSGQQQNPLNRFDVVMLEGSYLIGEPWLRTEAEAGRTRAIYAIGTDTVEVYARGDASLRP